MRGAAIGERQVGGRIPARSQVCRSSSDLPACLAPVIAGRHIGSASLRMPSTSRPRIAVSAELRSQLQATLGSAYTIDRELGGGGMSHVYVATEAELGRQIVVKVLPPDAAAAVSAARFKREIQVAARLQRGGGAPKVVAAKEQLGGIGQELEWSEPQTLYASVGPSTFDNRQVVTTVRTLKIVAIDLPTGKVHTVVEGDAEHRIGREEFSIRKGRLFLTLSSWESDVGVMQLIHRR